MKKKVLAVCICLVLLASAVYAGSSYILYRSVTSSDAANAEVDLFDARQDGELSVLVVPYGGDNGGEVNNTEYTTSGAFTLNVCPGITKGSSVDGCKDKMVEIDLTAGGALMTGSEGKLYSDNTVYGFVSVVADSMTIAGTDSPSFRIFLNKES